MQIFLSGDNAALWIPWAKSKLRRIKDLMRLSGRTFVSERFPLPDGRGELFVSSIAGQNEIRIVVEGGEAVLYICGQVVQNNDIFAWLLEKRNLNGFLVWQKVYNAAPDTVPSNTANGIAVHDNTQKLFICGKWYSETMSADAWQVECRETTGKQVWELTPDVKGEAIAIAVDDDAVYVVGKSLYAPLVVNAWDWRVEKRDKTDGALIWQRTVSIVPGAPITHLDSIPYAVDVDAYGFIYVAGNYAGYPGVECRDADGNLVWLKQMTTDGGIAVLDGSFQGVRVKDDGVYVVGSRKFTTPGAQYEWKVERRSTADGAVTWTQTWTSTGELAAALAISLGSDSVFICGYNDQSDPKWRVEKRLLEDGALDWEVRSALDPDVSYPNAIAYRDKRIYAGGALTTSGVSPVAQYYLEGYNDKGDLLFTQDMTKYLKTSVITGMAVGVR